MFKMLATAMCLTTLALAVIGQASDHDDERQGRGACIIFNNNIIIITLKLLCFYVLHIRIIIHRHDRSFERLIFIFRFRLN